MLIAGIVVGLIAGLLLGGRPGRLLDVRLRAPVLLFLAVVIRYGTELLLREGMPLAEQLRLPLFATAFVILLLRAVAQPRPARPARGRGGVAVNGLAMVVNAGWMPVWQPALEAAGLTTADLVPNFQRLLPTERPPLPAPGWHRWVTSSRSPSRCCATWPAWVTCSCPLAWAGSCSPRWSASTSAERRPRPPSRRPRARRPTPRPSPGELG